MVQAWACSLRILFLLPLFFFQIILKRKRKEKKRNVGDSLAVWWLELGAFTALVSSLIPGQGIQGMVGHTAWPKKEKIKSVTLMYKSAQVTTVQLDGFSQSEYIHVTIFQMNSAPQKPPA